MKQEAVQTKEEDITFYEKVKAMEAEVTENFNKFLSPEFKESTPELGERTTLLLEAFAKYKDSIELDTDYVVDGKTLKHLKSLMTSLLEGVSKGVDETNNYINLYNLVNDNNESIVLKQAQLHYLGELFSKCSFQTIEQGLAIKETQDGLRDLFNEMFFDTKKIQMAGQTVQTIEQGWKMEGLPQEDESKPELDVETCDGGECLLEDQDPIVTDADRVIEEK